MGFAVGARGKESTCQCRRHKRCRFDPRVGKIPWKRKQLLTPVFLPGESHRQPGGLWSIGLQSWPQLKWLGPYACMGKTQENKATHQNGPSPQPQTPLSTKKDVQLKSCELSFIWGKMRTAAREVASQIALRDCSKQAVGKVNIKGFGEGGVNTMKHSFYKRVLSVMRIWPHHEGI